MPDKLRFGIMGCGNIAHRHVSHLLNIPEAEIVALNDVSDASIERIKTNNPAIAELPVYKNYLEMMDNANLDAVVIATPHTLHFQQSMDAIDRGLHILLEKPMVCSVEHAEKLIAHAKKNNREIVLGYQRHYQPEYRHIKSVIEEGEIGKVTFVSALQCQQWKKFTAEKWRQDPELSGGGQLNDSGSHLIDAILWTTGLSVNEIYANIDNCGTSVDINSALALSFNNNAQGAVSIVGDSPCWYEDFTIWGETGVLFYRNGLLSVSDSDGNIAEPSNLPQAGNAAQNLVDVIFSKDINWAPPECGLRVIELTESAWKSAKIGSLVKIS